mmetsp:Transcript_41124/g.101502  ORF Transcript_41124/g.101502 Transcript_41124/m.101502 type:complete len:220 (+) Transcript_41124:1734-2393(+)
MLSARTRRGPVSEVVRRAETGLAQRAQHGRPVFEAQVVLRSSAHCVSEFCEQCTICLLEAQMRREDVQPLAQVCLPRPVQTVPPCEDEGFQAVYYGRSYFCIGQRPDGRCVGVCKLRHSQRPRVERQGFRLHLRPGGARHAPPLAPALEGCEPLRHRLVARHVEREEHGLAPILRGDHNGRHARILLVCCQSEAAVHAAWRGTHPLREAHGRKLVRQLS